MERLRTKPGGGKFNIQNSQNSHAQPYPPRPLLTSDHRSPWQTIGSSWSSAGPGCSSREPSQRSSCRECLNTRRSLFPLSTFRPFPASPLPTVGLQPRPSASARFSARVSAQGRGGLNAPVLGVGQPRGVAVSMANSKAHLCCQPQGEGAGRPGVWCRSWGGRAPW